MLLFSQAEANRLAKLAIQKGKEHSQVIAKKIIDKAKIEAKKLQDRKLIKNDSGGTSNDKNDSGGSEVCSLM